MSATTTPAVSPTPTTGNTALAPARLTGDPKQDQQIIQRWMNDLYDQLFKSANVIGSQAQMKQQIAVLQEVADSQASELRTLQADLATAEQQIVTLQGEVSSLQSDLTTTQASLVVAETEITAIRAYLHI